MIAQLDRAYLRTAGRRAAMRRLTSYALFEGRPATTRGQWINPLVRAQISVGSSFPVSRPLDRPIFLLGVGRSGTTHLGRLLSAHPDVGWLNEPKLIWNRIVPGEDVSGFYQATGSFVLTASHATPDVRERANRTFGHYLRTVHARRLLDKYPELTYRIPFLRALFPNARLVAIVRRPEDFVHSVIEWNREHSSQHEDWWGMDRRKWVHMRDELLGKDRDVRSALAANPEPNDVTMASTEWVLGMRSLLAHDSDLNLVVRYEALATNPVDTIRAVLRACQLDEASAVLELAETSTSRGLRDQEVDFGPLSALVTATRSRLSV